MAVLYHTGFQHQFPLSAALGFDLDESDASVPQNGAMPAPAAAEGRAVQLATYNTGTRDFGLSMLLNHTGPTLHLGCLQWLTVAGVTETTTPERLMAIFIDGVPEINIAFNRRGTATTYAGTPSRCFGFYNVDAFDKASLDVADHLGSTTEIITDTNSANRAMWWQVEIQRGASDGTITIRGQNYENPAQSGEGSVTVPELALSAGPITKVMYRGMHNSNQFTTTTRNYQVTHIWADDARPLGQARSVLLPLDAQGNYDDGIPSQAPAVDNFDLLKEVPPDFTKTVAYATVGDRESYELDGTPTLDRSQVAAISPRIRGVLAGTEELQPFIRQGGVDLPGGDPLTGSGVAENLHTSLNLNPHGGFWTPADITCGIELGFERTD
jgi:hypothetical protein